MEDKNREYEDLLRELLESRQYTKLRQTCADMQTADIAHTAQKYGCGCFCGPGV